MKYLPLLLGLTASLVPAGCIYETGPYAVREVVPGGLTPDEVLRMSKAGLSESVLLEKIKAEGVATRPDAAQIESLRNEGVSQPVLDALLTASVRPPQERVTNYASADPYPYSYTPYGYWSAGYSPYWYGGYGYYPYYRHYGYYPYRHGGWYYPRYSHSVSRYR